MDGARDFYISLDLHGHEIKRVSIEKLAVDPIDLFETRIWFNTTEDRLKLYDGSSVRNIKYLEEGVDWGDISGDIINQTDLQTILDGLVESGQYIFFLEDENDPLISGYKVMDNPAQLLNETYVTQNTIANDQIVQTWITDVGLPGTSFIPEGTWVFHINAYKTGGTKEVRLYNEMYKRAQDGTETILGTTANSIPLTDVEVALPPFNIFIPALTLLETDRIVTKTRMRLVGGGSNPGGVTLGFSGQTSARLSLPAQAVDITQFVRIVGDQNVSGVKTFTSSPIVPTPTTDFQTATKKYVDDLIDGCCYDFNWSIITANNLNLVSNNGYIINTPGLCTTTLPLTSQVGDIIKIVGIGTSLWRINQNASQTVFFGNQVTTTGAAGSLESSDPGDCIELVCITNNNDWRVASAVSKCITIT